MNKELRVRDKDAILQLDTKILPDLATRIHQGLIEIIPLFHDFKLEKVLDTWTKGPDAIDDTPISIENGNLQNLGLRILLEGFDRQGETPFYLKKDLIFRLNYNTYEVGPDKNTVWLEKHYFEPWTATELNEVAQRWCEELTAEITDKLEKFL